MYSDAGFPTYCLLFFSLIRMSFTAATTTHHPRVECSAAQTIGLLDVNFYLSTTTHNTYTLFCVQTPTILLKRYPQAEPAFGTFLSGNSGFQREGKGHVFPDHDGHRVGRVLTHASMSRRKNFQEKGVFHQLMSKRARAFSLSSDLLALFYSISSILTIFSILPDLDRSSFYLFVAGRVP